MIKCSDIEILLVEGILMFSLVSMKIASVLAWLLMVIVLIHIPLSKSTWVKIFNKYMN